MTESRFLIDYEECYDAIFELCEKAQETVYVLTWILDFDYRMNGRFTMRELLEDLAARGVTVKILLTPNVLYDWGLPEDLPEGCEVRFAETWGPKFRFAERAVLKKNVESVPSYDYRVYSVHQKLMAVDGRWALIGGTDVSEQRTGSEWTGETNSDGYIWSETALLTACDADLWRYCRDSFDHRGRAEIDSPVWVGPFPTASHEARATCELIRDSRELLYIENQYISPFLSARPDVMAAIAERIVRAVREGTPWYGVVVTNFAHVDSGPVMRFAFRQNLFGALRELERRVIAEGVTPEQLAERFVCAHLRRRGTSIFVHAKLLLCDSRRGIVTSSNLNHRSMGLGEDVELGVRFDDEILARGAQQRLVAKHLGEDATSRNLSPKDIFEAVRAETGNFERVPKDPSPRIGGLGMRGLLWFCPHLQ